MSLTKKILLAIGIAFIAIQLIQPVHNKSSQVLETDISKMFTISDGVKAVLNNACFDCHSNNTNYPWYSNIQPMGWLIAKHIKQGKEELNFSDFGSYSTRRQLSKLNGIANSIRDNIMPLSSYKIMHRNAQLSTDEKTFLIYWTEKTLDSLATKN